MTSNRNNFFTAYTHSNNSLHSIEHQQSSSQQLKLRTIKPVNIFFNESNQPSINNNIQHKKKGNLYRQSPFLIHRHHSNIENHSSHQQSLDLNACGNQLHLILPPHIISQNKSSHRKTLKYSKTIHENTIKHIPINSKFLHSFQTPIWSPKLTEKDIAHTRTLPSRIHLLKHQQLISKQNTIPNLYKSSKLINKNLEIFNKTTVKDLVDEWEDPLSNVAVVSDAQESINPSMNIQNSSLIIDHHQLSSNDKSKSTKKINIRQRPYSMTLPSVTEHIDEDMF